MDPTLASIFELGLFFALLVINLQIFKAVRYEHLFKKGKTTEIQVVYIIIVLIVTYLLTRTLMNLFELTFNLT